MIVDDSFPRFSTRIFMIVDDSFLRLTTHMIVHDSFWSAVFPENQRARLKWPPNGSSRGSAAASEIRVYIQDDNHDKENSEDQDKIEKICSEGSVNSQELGETPQKKRSLSLNVHRSRRAMRRDGVMT